LWSDGPTQVRLVRLTPDGAPAWVQDLGVHEAWSCCALTVAEDTVRATGPQRSLELDLTSGDVLVEESYDPPRQDQVLRPPWEAATGVFVSWAPDGRSLTIMTNDGSVTVRGTQHVDVHSFDPLVFSDAREAIR